MIHLVRVLACQNLTSDFRYFQIIKKNFKSTEKTLKTSKKFLGSGKNLKIVYKHSFNAKLVTVKDIKFLKYFKNEHCCQAFNFPLKTVKISSELINSKAHHKCQNHPISSYSFSQTIHSINVDIYIKIICKRFLCFLM